MLSAAILKPLELGIPKVTFFVGGSACKDVLQSHLILGETDLNFSFTVDGARIEQHDDIALLGINIDSKLSFSKHISHICERVNNQSRVIGRFGNLLSGSIQLRLYKAFVQPIFQYCIAVWHFCAARNSNKLELVNK